MNLSQIKGLLSGITETPWTAYSIMRHVNSPSYVVGADGSYVAGSMTGDGVTKQNSALVTAAPLLAKELERLYGREPEVKDYSIHEVKDGVVYDVEELVVLDVEAGYFTADEAEDIARAMLSAANKVRGK